MPKRTIYALFVGINVYKHGSKNLNYCVNDINALNQYLREITPDNFEYLPLLLEDSSATRVNIIAKFRSHLIHQADENDIALFYFSGHGGQEEAPAYFKDYDRADKIEGIVCHDTGNKGEYKIADKELRYLLNLLSAKECEIISIFDCCHSGENTRLNDENIIEKRDQEVGTARPIDDFIFSENPIIRSRLLAKEESVDDIIPQGRYLQMAACQDWDHAVEHKGFKHGLFTYYLLENLKRHKALINYQDLITRIHVDIKSLPFELSQRPKVYTPKDHRELIFTHFLSGKIKRQPLSGTIYFDPKQEKWLLDFGAFHGLSVHQKDQEEAMYTVLGDLGFEKLTELSIEKVFNTNSEVSFELREGQEVDLAQKYTAYIDGGLLHPLYIQVQGEKTGIKTFDFVYRKKKEDLLRQGISFVEDLTEINDVHAVKYQLMASKGSYSLCLPGEERALVPPVRGYQEASVNVIFEQLLLMGKWNFTKYLLNPKPSELDPGVKLTVHLLSENRQIEHSGTKHLELMHKANPMEKDLEVRFSFQNQGRRDVFFSCIYLDSEFGVSPNFQENSPDILKTEGTLQSISIPEKKKLKMKLPPFFKDNNWEKETVYLKVILSTNTFDPNIFYSPSIVSIGKPNMNKRGLELVEDEVLEDWTTQIFGFDLINPHYKKGLPSK